MSISAVILAFASWFIIIIYTANDFIMYNSAECYHYLFRMAYDMKNMGLLPDAAPVNERGITDIVEDNQADDGETDR